MNGYYPQPGGDSNYLTNQCEPGFRKLNPEQTGPMAMMPMGMSQMQTPMPVIQQPVPQMPYSMAAPQVNVPAQSNGLESLLYVDKLLVKQKFELLEAIVGFETSNQFSVKNQNGQKLFRAYEESDCLTRNCCGSIRPFKMQILDMQNRTVLTLKRPFACDTCLLPFCLQSIDVYDAYGTFLGSVKQKWTILKPTFSIKDCTNKTVLHVKGPFCRYSICGDVDYHVVATKGNGRGQVGRISKQWSGLSREFFTDADFFGISFPIDLDVRIKAVLLAACFLIDAMYYEKSGHRENDRLGMW